MNKKKLFSKLKEYIEFSNPPYEIRLNGKIVDDLDVLFEYIIKSYEDWEKEEYDECPICGELSIKWPYNK